VPIQRLATGWLFSPVSATNKTDHHDITEILLQVALITITLTPVIIILFKWYVIYTNTYLKLLANLTIKTIPMSEFITI
jgi:hypothetical protein